MRPQSHRRRFVNKILTLFKKTHSSENAQYPSALLVKYKISDKTIGVGSFAVVKQCTEVNSNEECAVKIILKKVIADILKHVRHAHIVSMRDIYESEDAVYIVTDLCTGGELFQRIVERGTYTESIAADLVRQILEGVSYLHSQDLLFKTPAENSALLITDFGLAKLLKDNSQVLTTACGTPGYVAPEVLMATGHGKPVDLWSIGVIMYTLLSGYTPFYGEDQTQLFDAIVRGDYQFDEEYWSEISEEAKALIKKFLTLDPKKRITADEALQDQWIKGLSKTGINLAPNVRKGLNNHHDLKTLVTIISFVKKLKMVDDLVTDDETD
ncbi:Pkinase-domain-containing protein, partial [Backusella circina FSU 941]